MSQQLKEHRPLLEEEASDEEVRQEFRPRRHMGYRGKAKNTVKGAAAIIRNWPDYWSSSVTYWWLGIAMFALMTFLLYSSVVTYSMLPAANSVPIPQLPTVTERNSTLPEVFMHVIVNNQEKVDLNKYLPYLEIISNKYLHYKFNFMIMINDTAKPDQTKQQARVNNEDAMNSLWTEDNILQLEKVTSKPKSNIHVQYVNLSNYLNGSPLQHVWKQVPRQLMEFLVRAVSIWDKGGIAFNPIILTPRSPDAIYIEKLYSLLSSYEECKEVNVTTSYIENNKIPVVEKPKVLNSHKHKHKKTVNNIRDIIDALETEVPVHQNQLDAISEAETIQELTLLEMNPMKTERAVRDNSISFNRTDTLDGNVTNIGNFFKNNRSEIFNFILPSFFDFFFHDKQNTSSQDDLSVLSTVKRSTRTLPTESTKVNLNTQNEIQPMIITAPVKFNKIPSKIEGTVSNNNGDVENLTIDLKGNILATKSSCHAFLGSIFSNIKYRTEQESLKEFIIGELSLFCNGLLSSCKGIDIILI